MRPKKTILCVDDNEQALSVRKFMLETRGYRVLGASHAEQALEMFEEGGIDLVLSDLILPRMDGNELIRRLKELAPDVPMVLLSGCVRAFDRASHADAFLPKGACSPLEILERVRLLLARRRGPKSAAARGAQTGPSSKAISDLVSEPTPVAAFPPAFHADPFPPEVFRTEALRPESRPADAYRPDQDGQRATRPGLAAFAS